MPRGKKATKDTEVRSTPKVDDGFEPWTVDIRESHEDDVTTNDLAKIEKTLAERGRKLSKLYCTDKQREALADIKEYAHVELVK